MAKARVVVIGGGIAGMTVAHALVEKARREAEVTVVTKDTFYMTGPSRPLVLTNEQSYDRMTRGYEEAAARGIDVVYGLVTAIDPAERVVEVAEAPTRSAPAERISYDYLVAAPGVVLDGSSVEGYMENRHRNATVYEPGRLDVLKHRIWTAARGTVVVYAPPQPYRCAPAPAETALAVHTVLKHRGVRDRFRIVHVDANDKPQPPVIADVVKARYEEAGIELVTGRRIAEVTPSHVVLEDGERIEYTILSMLEPNRAPRFIAEAGLGGDWFEVRSPWDTRSPRYDDVLAAGDAAKLPFPKNQEVAHESALYTANKLLEMLGAGAEPYSVQYTFTGWAYLGNLEGRLETESVQFSLSFASKPPRASKDPEPRRSYTLQKDRWEQSYLNRLYHPKG